MSRRRSGRRTDASGRSKGEAKHVREYEWMLSSPAYRSLNCYARCLLQELKRLYIGDNNGELFMSVRFAADCLGTHKDTAAKAFRDLQERGFIRPRTKSGFSWKRGQATTWILTEYEFAGQLPTKAFMKWKPEPGKAEHGPTRPHRVSYQTAHCPTRPHTLEPECPTRPHTLGQNGAESVLPDRTQLVYQVGDPALAPVADGRAAAAEPTNGAGAPPVPDPVGAKSGQGTAAESQIGSSASLKPQSDLPSENRRAAKSKNRAPRHPPT